jgi:hypothetical protein
MLETTAAAVQDKIGRVVPAAEEVLIRASTDMEADGRFGRQWLVATAVRVVVVPEREGAAVQEVVLAELRQARTEPMVGGGQLELERRDGPTVYLPYSGSEGSKFSEIARGLEQLRQGEPLVINAHVESLRCAKCERLLPEKDGICPACISRTARILVVTVDTSHSFNTFAVDPFHIHPPPLWMQVFGASNRQKKAADPLVRTRSSKKNRRENSLRRESRLFYFLNLWNFPELQAQATIH